ncbi:uncharacterized protein LOC119549999 isoform X8 [Drosophila subpulchrella]|uniref:uncharacterized protein LOC119549999 isoform X8 n=1 Tax=Drosophila subpulchrella TaxID=1486046 RepID=UPI0018A16DEF|nr:uncharacterized protein LOC119549999 isoform X8 [Drosophila subpulchrella]
MCNANPQYCCVFIGVVAILSGFVDGGYKVYQLAVEGMNNWLLAAVVAWTPILIASIFLILGALKKIPRFLLVWIIVSLVCGIALIIIKTGLLIYLHDSPIINDIVTAILNIIFLLLVFVWAFYPYAYMRDMKKPLLE